jgi:hypothetical protein
MATRPGNRASAGAFGLAEIADAMSKVPWILFQGREPQLHLVVGALTPDASSGDKKLPVVQQLLLRLVRSQKPAGDFASTVVRDAGSPQMYFAFENEADARTFAAVVAAQATTSFPGWASAHAFPVQEEVLAALEPMLPLPRIRPRLPDQEGPRMRGARVRRGPRAPIKQCE